MRGRANRSWGPTVLEPNVVGVIHSMEAAPPEQPDNAAIAALDGPSPPSASELLTALNAVVSGIKEIARPLDDGVAAVVASPLPPTSVHEAFSAPILVEYVDASAEDDHFSLRSSHPLLADSFPAPATSVGVAVTDANLGGYYVF